MITEQAGATRLVAFMDPVTTLTSIRDGYLAALLADSITPKLDYNIDGQAVSRSAWRMDLMRLVKEMNEVIQAYQPFEIQTLGVN